MLKKNKASDTVFKSLLTVTFVICLAAAGETSPAGTPPFSQESIEWCDIWISHADETNLPRVLLIGDSISRDYYPGVEKRLAGKAYVARLSTSAFVSDPVLLKEIKMVLGEYQFDVIHFNNGMHGWQHSGKRISAGLPEVFREHPEIRAGGKIDLGDYHAVKSFSEIAAGQSD